MAIFNMYTYQFNPLQKTLEGSLFDEFFIHQQKELMDKKNILFERCVINALDKSEFFYRGRKLSIQQIFIQEHLIAFKLANKKRVVLEKEFIESVETNEPSVLILIYNDPEIQRIAIEQHREAFPDTDIVAKILQKTLCRLLLPESLNISIRKEYNYCEFWDFIKQNRDQIQMVRFEFNYPNLPRLRDCIGDVIKDATEALSGDKAIVQYESSCGRLALNENNVELDQLNKVSSAGGNPIVFRLKGQRAFHKTGETSIVKEIDELDITANNVAEIKAILNTLDI